MEWLVENWYVLFGIVAVIFAAVFAGYKFASIPTAQQIANIKEWLKYAVTVSEKELGGGTGQLKLRMVYDMAVAKFSWIIKVITFEEFSKWVDDALTWLREQLDSNKAISNIVNTAPSEETLSE